MLYILFPFENPESFLDLLEIFAQIHSMSKELYTKSIPALLIERKPPQATYGLRSNSEYPFQ